MLLKRQKERGNYKRGGINRRMQDAIQEPGKRGFPATRRDDLLFASTPVHEILQGHARAAVLWRPGRRGIIRIVRRNALEVRSIGVHNVDIEFPLSVRTKNDLSA